MKRPWLVPAAVVLVTAAAFAPALSNGFVNWDDFPWLVNNPLYRGLGWTQLRWMFTSAPQGIYQPLSWLSYAVDHLLWGENPAGYHLTSLVLHAINALLFYALALDLLPKAMGAPRDPDDLALPLAAGFASLVFAVHPLRVESVAWASERRDVLSGLFYLLTVHFYLRSWERGAWASYLLSLLSKGIGVSLPAVLLVIDLYPLRRPLTRRLLIEKVPFVLMALAFGAVGLAAEARHTVMPSLAELSLSARLAQASYGALFYLRKTLWPAGLSPLYEAPRDLSLGAFPYLPCALGVAFLCAAAWLLRRRWPAFTAGWACYLATLLPVLGLVQFGKQLVADRYSYLACLCWALLGGGGLLALVRRAPGAAARRAVLAAAGLTVAALGAATWRQTFVWRDSLSLWRRAVALSPEGPVARLQLGLALARAGRADEAGAEFLSSLALEDSWGARFNLAVTLQSRGRWAEAAEQYRAALAFEPGDAVARNNLGVALGKQGRWAEAAEEFAESVRLDPGDAAHRANLELALAEARRLRRRR